MASQARQGSIYSLTLNEVEHHLGEPLHSMNLDELLQSVLSAQSLSMSLNGSIPSIHHEGSITMDRALSKKTVDEVWREIHHGHKNGVEVGEMTLEAFLAKAGAVSEGINGKGGPANTMADLRRFGQRGDWLPQHHQDQVGVYADREGQVEVSPSFVRMTSGRNRRPVGDVVERTIERRQKRMIKNRESAARSRARKQAYTHELENKVSRLEEENEILKKHKKLETILHYIPPPEPKYQLRRSSSGPY